MPSPLQGSWDPLTSLEETEPGVWLMGKGHQEPYAIIRIIRHGDTWRPQVEDRELIGYYRRLRAAAKAAHKYQMRKAVEGAYWTGAPNGGR